MSEVSILLVEDDIVDRMAFTRHIERAALPYKCRTAESLAEAMELLVAERFDVIVLDHNLTDGLGFDLLPHVGDTPVIFVTGSENPENAVTAMKAGANDYLLKDQHRHYLQLLPLSVDRALRLRADREALREMEELFHKSFTEAPIGKAFISPAGRFLRVNPALCKIFGFAEEDFLARGCELMFGAQQGPDCMGGLFSTLNGPVRSTRTEMRCRTQKGNEIWIQLDLALVPDSRGKSLTYIAQVQDITARKLAEAAVRQAKEYAENIVNAAPTLICGLSPDGVARFVNPAATQITGYAAGEIVGQNWWRLFYPGAAFTAAEKLLAEAERGRVINQETTITARDGTKRILSWSSVHCGGASGAGGEVIGIGLDITGQRRAEEVRSRLETQLRQSQKMEALGSLAGGVAHEFNNMLGAIMGYTELTKMELGEGHALCEYLDQVLKAGQRAKEIVQQILTFSRRQELKRDLLQSLPMVQESVKLIRPTIPNTVEIRIAITPDSPPLFGNATQIHQALTNLCTNAWHAMGDRGGSIVISQKTVVVGEDASSARLALPAGPYSVLTVTDNGKGMDAATLDRVFEPFFTTKGPGKGNGLGMPVVHGIMKAHDGAVTIQSELNKGTVVQLYFPVRGPAHAEPAAAEAPPPHGRGQRVLLVDDEQALVQIGTKMLQHLGYQVNAFTSAKQGLAAFRENPGHFDLVLTDLTMPGMSGIDLTDELLKIRRDIPVILTTGFVEDGIREQANLLGFREILLKPLGTKVLAEAIERVLTKPAG